MQCMQIAMTCEKKEKKEVSSAHQGWIYLIKNTVKNLKYYCNLKEMFYMWIYVQKRLFFFLWSNCIFSIITPVFRVTWSSEIIIICWFAAQETFLIIIDVENSCAAKYFCWSSDPFYCIHFQYLMNRKHLFKIENILNIFTITFEQFNASLLNKSNNFIQKACDQ